MTDTLTVLNAMKEYYSPDGDTQELLPMCEAACRELAAMVKPEADLGDIRLINAAAAFAYRRFCIKSCLTTAV